MTFEKNLMFLIGLLIVIAGGLPLIATYYPVPIQIPISGWRYQALIIVLGLILVFFGRPRRIAK